MSSDIHTRKRAVKRTVIAVIIGIAVIASLGYWQYSNKTATESVTDIPGQPVTVNQPQTATTTTAPTPEPMTSPTVMPKNPTATFSGIDGRKTSGSAIIVTTSEGTFVRLEDDFVSSGSAPDNRLYLGNKDGFQIEIAKLKAPNGGQNFRLPDDINIRDYSYLWIHCKAFNTTYGKAEIIF